MTSGTTPWGMSTLGPGGGITSQAERYVSGYGSPPPLPRPVADFLAGAFGPLQPINPFAIDVPKPGETRPEPRRWEYPVGLDIPSFPGNLKMVSFATLRQMGDMYSVARSCIRQRIQEILALDYDIVPDKHLALLIGKSRTYRKEFEDRRKQILLWFRRPDSNYRNLHNWLNAVLEDLFVVDALSLYLHPTPDLKSGVLGSNVNELQVLDGTTIYPLVDMRGSSPKFPNVAYQQYLYGVPRTDLATTIPESEWDDLKLVKEYRGDQLLYAPMASRSWTTYGFPPLEQAILPATIGLRRQEWRLEYFTSGTVPSVYLVAPPEWSPQQCRQLQDALNAYSASEMRWRHIVLPGNSDPKPMKQDPISSEADNTIYEETLMAFDIAPVELGLTPGGRGVGMSGGELVQGTKDVRQGARLRSGCRWLEETIFDFIIHELFHQKDMRWRFDLGEEEDDQQKMAQTYKTYVDDGIMTRDEVRKKLGYDPFGFDNTMKPTMTGFPPAPLWQEVPDQPAGGAPGAGGPPGMGGPPPDMGGGMPPPDMSGTTPPPGVQAPPPQQGMSAVPDLDKTLSIGSNGHDSSCLLIPIVGQTAQILSSLAREIPDELLASDGREIDFHVTLFYGIAGLDVTPLLPILDNSSTFSMKCQGISIFPGGPLSDYDVVKVDIESRELIELNEKVRSIFPQVELSYPSYSPHATLAYVAKGSGEAVVDRLLETEAARQLIGRSIRVSSIEFSGFDGNSVRLPLGKS